MNDAGGSAREVVEDPTLGEEADEELALLVVPARELGSKELHRDGLAEAQMGAAVDVAEATAADERIDPVLRLEHRTEPTERIGRGPHRAQRTPSRGD